MYIVSDFRHILKNHPKIFGFIVAIIISVLIFINRDRFVDLQGYGLVGLFLLSILGNATIILPVPVVLAAFVGGVVFNPLVVTVVVSAGASIGELTGYLAGISGQELIREKKFAKIIKWNKKYGLWALFVLAAIPNPLFDLAGIVAGATRIPVYKYFIIVWAGKLIKFGIIAYLGASSVGLVDGL